MKSFSTYILSFLMFFTILNLPAVAQWSTNQNLNTAISTTIDDQGSPASVSDGAGGVIITWEDYRNGDNDDIYAQRINASGVLQWTADGVAISTASESQSNPAIVSDGAGGAIIIWEDYRNGNSDIYAQRVNASGVVQWTADGIGICTTTQGQSNPVITTDGTGGAIITWYDYRNSDADIFAQSVNASGVVQWTADGVGICTAGQSQYSPAITTDGAGGAIITWEDNRSGGNNDIYAQWINALGVVQWAADGVGICTATQEQSDPAIITDGAGGAIITWEDNRTGNNDDIYAQWINALGVVQWTANGEAICNATNYQDYPNLTSDGAGGAIITWHDNRTNNYAVYAQRIAASGVIQWTANGIEIGTNVGEDDAHIISDGTGGAIIAWEGYNDNDDDIYTQRINADGIMQWTAGGLGICTAPNNQDEPTITGDGSGGAIIIWEDQRNSDGDIYAQWVNGSSSNFQPLAGQILSIHDVENDQGGNVRINWQSSPNDITEGSSFQITTYGVWRKIPEGMKSGGVKNPQRLFVNDTLGALYDFITSVPAVQSPTYNVVAPTLDDSSSSGAHLFTYLVTAHTSSPLTYFITQSASGYSVDNLAPGAVQMLAAQALAGPTVRLSWNKNITDPDVSAYEIHRSTTGGFMPGALTKIAQTSDTMLVDGSPVQGAINYYRVVTLDLHGNQSSPSVEASAELGVTVLCSMNDKWNMVSVSLNVSDYTKAALFPTAVSAAFAYEAGYLSKTTLSNGVGYWLKFSGDQTVAMTGSPFELDTIDLIEGWNMIGAISSPVAVTAILSLTPGLTLSPFFGYANGYVIADTLAPAKGYWVKANKNGQFILSSVVSKQASGMKITIVATTGLPPPPPDGDLNSPPDADQPLADNNSIVPDEITIFQNYPNPFNPSTVIRYSLPVHSAVTLKVYNMLGEELATLVDGMQDAGYHTVEWNAVSLPSGVYFCKIEALSFGENAKPYRDMKPMLLMR